MNVLLIYPPNPDYCVLSEDFSLCEPLGLEYIAASLLRYHDVQIMDMRFDRDLESKISQGNYDAVGVAVPFTTSINTCNRLVKKIREIAPNMLVILGGHYPSTSLNGLHLHYVDYVVVGEGIHTINELLLAHQKGTVKEVSGVAIINQGKPEYTPEREYTNLDACPLPARHLLADYREKYFHAHYKPITLMRFSVGCPYNCSFCILWKMTNRGYFSRGSESILEELNLIENENIYVVDDEAFIQIPRMHQVADDIISANIRKNFHMYVRSDTVVNNPKVFEKWARAGLDSVLIGLESIFEDELDEYKKKISYDIARECVNILHANNIEIRANFIIKPDYTREKFNLVKEAIQDLDIDRPTFAVLTPFIGTETYTQVKDQFIIDNPEFFDCYHTLLQTKLPLKTFYAEFANLFRSAQSRGQESGNNKIFYSGKDNTFHKFVDKIENSYKYYSAASIT